MNMLDRVYQKSHITFAVGWIVTYVVLSSIADNVSQDLGTPKLVTVVVQVAMAALLWGWVCHARAKDALGMRAPQVPAARMLFYLPLLVMATKKLWPGMAMGGTALEGVCWVASMICVGFLEEVIFRGLLFWAMEPNGRTSAIVVSSLTFGIGHIVNLFNGSGQSRMETLAQVVFAVSVGFVLVLVMLKSGSLWPCIGFHMLNNALSFFENEAATIAFYGSAERAFAIGIGASVLVAVLYIIWLLRLPDAEFAQH